jgi:hypothetical protein
LAFHDALLRQLYSDGDLRFPQRSWPIPGGGRLRSDQRFLTRNGVCFWLLNNQLRHGPTSAFIGGVSCCCRFSQSAILNCINFREWQVGEWWRKACERSFFLALFWECGSFCHPRASIGTWKHYSSPPYQLLLLNLKRTLYIPNPPSTHRSPRPRPCPRPVTVILIPLLRPNRIIPFAKVLIR